MKLTRLGAGGPEFFPARPGGSVRVSWRYPWPETGRGWLEADGTATGAGSAARERIEVETDEHCAGLWAPIGATGTRRLAELLKPVDEAFTTAGTYAQLG